MDRDRGPWGTSSLLPSTAASGVISGLHPAVVRPAPAPPPFAFSGKQPPQQPSIRHHLPPLLLTFRFSPADYLPASSPSTVLSSAPTAITDRELRLRLQVHPTQATITAAACTTASHHLPSPFPCSCNHSAPSSLHHCRTTIFFSAAFHLRLQQPPSSPASASQPIRPPVTSPLHPKSSSDGSLLASISDVFITAPQCIISPQRPAPCSSMLRRVPAPMNQHLRIRRRLHCLSHHRLHLQPTPESQSE